MCWSILFTDVASCNVILSRKKSKSKLYNSNKITFLTISSALTYSTGFERTDDPADKGNLEQFLEVFPDHGYFSRWKYSITEWFFMQMNSLVGFNFTGAFIPEKKIKTKLPVECFSLQSIGKKILSSRITLRRREINHTNFVFQPGLVAIVASSNANHRSQTEKEISNW